MTICPILSGDRTFDITGVEFVPKSLPSRAMSLQGVIPVGAQAVKQQRMDVGATLYLRQYDVFLTLCACWDRSRLL